MTPDEEKAFNAMRASFQEMSTKSANQEQSYKFMKQKFQELVGIYDALVAQNKKLEKDNSDLLQTLDGKFKEQSSKDEDAHKVLLSAIDKARSFSEEKDQKTQRVIADMAASLDKLKENFSQGIAQNQSEISQCKAALQTFASREILDAMKKNQQDFAMKLDEQKAQLDKLTSADQNRTYEFYTLKSEVQKTGDAVNTLTQKEKVSSETVLKNSSDLRAIEQKAVKFEQDVIRVAASVGEQINAIPKPSVPSIEDFKKGWQQQFEPISLDAKNAALRSTNSEYKINILEKRLEQLNLLLVKQAQG